MSADDPIPAWLETPEGVRHALTGDCGLGRATENDIVINDLNVSRRHALIQSRDKSGFWIIDLGAKNGISVNGSRVATVRRLLNGDTIRIGDSIFHFVQLSTDRSIDRISVPSVAATNVRVEHMDCWLLFVDIKGWGRLSQGMPQGEADALLSRALARPQETIERSGGRLDKHLGDGFLAFWRGAECPAEKIAKAAAELRQRQVEAEIPFRVVLHRGGVSIGATPTPGEELQTGNEIVFVFRLEELASSRQIDFCVSSEAQRHLAAWLKIEFISGEIELRELSGRHSVYRLV